ncbi:redox-sensitive transcriptional activator SoxR [Phytomonospora endophytica]|uniref:MerR family redox-sensitive transcriptional activator SoxR n=1 Tax=Phytomonospora endophytica TaxID=714109 RepID=A0A841FUH7_9ACTN|nr:MerR family redox-sensitive transcriptional activator SoxR [Phytomonospora endophytica]GIG69459.1 redox-sensitive transcriptional activator SoxR [Phytomonospora endophytica]
MSQISPSCTELTVGQVAERSGLAVSALHFYERKGLIESRRTSGNQRRYRRDILRRVAFIRASQRLGIPLSTIREGLALLPDGRTPTQGDWVRLAHAWRTVLDARIAEMNHMRNTLAGCIGCGCLSLEHCMLANPDDALGADGGTGPLRLFPQDDRDPVMDERLAVAIAVGADESGDDCVTCQ